MDPLTFRHRVLEIQAELAELDPRAPGAADTAQGLSAELETLAAEQRERHERTTGRAFGQAVAPTGVDAPVETLTAMVDQVESLTGQDPTDQAGAPE